MLRNARQRVQLRSWQLPELAVDLLREVRAHAPAADLNAVAHAFAVAEEAHEGQTRKSGDAYITHPVEVTRALARYGADTETLQAALLHDVVEDTPVTADALAATFGPTVSAIVEGVTKLERVEDAALPAGEAGEEEQRQAETLRRMVLSMSEDVRVLLVKLVDRLHNIRTIDPLPEETQRRKASETMRIYAPLAHRLGMQQVKHELEDRCFAVLHPEEYERIAELVAARARDRDDVLARFASRLEEQLRQRGIDATVSGRPKHYWSIREKMRRRGVGFDDIYDLVGLRVIVDGIDDCYRALGVVHRLWPPVAGGFTDYIAAPKYNLYQSLHTDVIGDGGVPVEAQIRTRAMHDAAEVGPAAHWRYKDDAHHRGAPQQMATPGWLQNLADWSASPDLTPADARAYLEALAGELAAEDVHVLTPQGQARSLPPGATVLDFAYSIHTDIGDHARAARVNGTLTDVAHRLASGDTVEVLTADTPQVQPEWLDVAASQRARAHIRRRLRSAGPQALATDVEAASCCRPVPGDAIVGAGGIVHRSGCLQAAYLSATSWPPEPGGRWPAWVCVRMPDEPGALGRTAGALSDAGVTVRSSATWVEGDHAHEHFLVVVSGLAQLRAAIDALDRLGGAVDPRRPIIVDGQPDGSCGQALR